MTARPGLWVKICGVTTPEDAESAVDAGADALGLNFVPSSRRRIEPAAARIIADRVRGRVELVGVVADLGLDAAEALRGEVGLDWLQLHGDEPPELVARLPRAFKALGIASAEDVARAASYAGERLLADAPAAGQLGGTGKTFDWSLVTGLAGERALILAGGLGPGNVARAVERVRPFGVDAASGLETAHDARRKDPSKMRAFVLAARAAFGSAP